MVRFKNNKAITLISLIITIVIMLILAGVSVSFIVGDNGLFKKAKMSADKYKVASDDEQSMLKNGEDLIDLAAGDVEDKNLIILYTAQDVKDLENRVNSGEDLTEKIIRLGNDIDLSAICSESKGTFTSIGNTSTPFKGNFDGQGYTLKNLYINKNEVSNLGLFGVIEDSKIYNLKVTGSVIGNKSNIAGIIGYSKNSDVQNCENSINVKNNATTSEFNNGGIIGESVDTYVNKCKNYGIVESLYRQAGGIIGTSTENTTKPIIENCVNYGNVTSTNISGGIVGYINTDYIVRNCINKSEASITVSVDMACGGIVGFTNSDSNITIQDCVNEGSCLSSKTGCAGILGGTTGAVLVNNCKNIGLIKSNLNGAGGIIGYTDGDASKEIKITNCENTAKIETTSWAVAGILGSANENCDIEFCKNLGEVYAGIGNAGGILGSNYDNGTKTTNKSKSTITNCYNAGVIINSYLANNAGQIIGKSYNSDTVTNCYGTTEVNVKNTYGGTIVSSTTLKGYSSILGEAYKVDANSINQGYPILNWQ